MALVLNDRVKETSTTTGQGTLDLAGAATGFETFVTGIGDNNTTYYAIVHESDGTWEIGIGTVDDQSTDTLARTTVIDTSAGNTTKIDFAAGSKTVFCTLPSSKAVFLDADGDVTLGANLDVGGNLTVTGTTTFNGGTLTLGDANTDNIVFGGEVDSDIIPDDDGTFDLGSASKEWQDIFIDGTAKVDTLTVDENATVAGTLGVTGVLTANAGVVVDNITIDGTEIDLSSGDLTVDVAGDIILDADGGDIFIKDGGTQIGSISNAGSNNFQIASSISNGDLLFKGSDGGSTITALTLDMSAAGAAIFNDKITAVGTSVFTNLDISGDVDVDGTLEADAITVNGTALAEFISDTTGAMVGSNTETGIAVTYQDADNTIDFVINAAQTTITSLFATDIKIGEDDQTKIDFETADEIHFYAANVEQVYLGDNIFGPQSDSDVDLGSTGVRWKDAFIDTVTTTGDLTVGGNFTVNGTTTTVATTNMVVADNLIELNNGAGSNSNDSGLVIERGSTGDNAIFMWDESADTFVLGTTTATGASTGNLSVTDGALQAGSLDISGNIDVDGTTNLDAVDIDGAVQIDAAVTVGVDDTGYDFKLFGATSGAHIIWDASDDALETVGGATINIVKDKLKIAGTAVTTTAAELNKLDGVTATTAELNYVDGVTSAIQTQLDTKTTPGFALAMAVAL